MKRAAKESLNNWKLSSTRKPLILRGARQVGKTYILKEFGSAAFPRCHYVNFEEDESLGRIFEEIQRCPRALTSLKYFSEDMPELALCAAGSLLGVTLHEDSFPVGKVQFLDMHPLAFDEFLDGAGKERLAELIRKHDLTQPFPATAHEQLWGLWKHFLVVGGLPEAVNSYRERQDNLYEAVQMTRKVQRDLLGGYLGDMG